MRDDGGTSKFKFGKASFFFTRKFLPSFFVFSLFFFLRLPKQQQQQHALSLQSPQARARALLTLRTVNGWSAEDAGVYWRGREELALSRSGSGGGGSGDGEQQKPKTKTKKKSPPPSSSWRIDARWLESQGVDLEELSPAWRQLLL